MRILLLTMVVGLLCLHGCDSSRDSPAAKPPESKPAASADAPPGAGRTPPSAAAGERITTGHRAPAFRLPDQHGHEHALEDLLQGDKLALVFFRSADW